MKHLRIEALGKRALERFPMLKHSAKRVYQMTNVLLNHEKIKAEGNIYRVSPDDGYEYFYGYYDKSPWDSTSL